MTACVYKKIDMSYIMASTYNIITDHSPNYGIYCVVSRYSMPIFARYDGIGWCDV